MAVYIFASLKVVLISIMLNLFPIMSIAAPLDGTIIINRSAKSIDVFLTMSGDTLTPLTGTNTAFLTRSDGTVRLRDFRVETATFGDRVFAPVRFSVESNPVNAQAIALMLHTKDGNIPFGTPWDAMMAVTLCSVNYSDDFPTLANVQSYLGYSLYPVDGTASLRIIFPQTGRADLQFEMLEFMDGDLIARRTLTLGDDADIYLNVPSDSSRTPMALILLVAIIGVCAIAMARQSSTTLTSPLFDD